MPADDREPKFERALAHHLRRDSAAACPDAEALAAYQERALSLEEMTHWKQHISGCRACQETLALVESTENQLAEDWKEKKIPVLAAADETFAPVGAAVAGSVTASGEEALARTARPAGISWRPRPPLLRWAVPLGAVAAGVLVWIGIHEQRALESPTSPATQIAKNEPAPSPEQKATDELERAQGSRGREQLQAQIAEDTAHKRAANTMESRRVSPPVAAAKPSAKDAELAKREAAGQREDALAYKVAPAAPPAEPQTQVPSSMTQNVEVSSGAPSTAPRPAPAATDAVGSGIGGAMSAAETQSVNDAKRKKSLDGQAANDVDSPMMMKQGVNGRNMTARYGLVPAPAVILTPDNHVWWKLGSGGALELTTDGGKTWKAVDTGTAAQLTAGSAPSSKICWIAGKAGTLVLTTDRGAHWRAVSAPISGDLGGVRATDAKHAIVWDTARQQSFETSDGGVTWTQTAP
jgi:hypothetical protein